MDDLNLRFKLLWGLLGTLVARWHGALQLTLTPTLLSNLVLSHLSLLLTTSLSRVPQQTSTSQAPEEGILKMASTPPTIVSLKQSFLTTQTRLLSQPLAPTRAWSSHNSTQEDNALSEKAIDDALFKLNHRLHQHSRRVYAPQATRHVAEQIDQLYWNAAEAATSHTLNDDGNEPTDGEGLTLGADLGIHPTAISPHK